MVYKNNTIDYTEIRIKVISYKKAVNFIMPRHYANRIPSIVLAFGFYYSNTLIAVCTFGKPASPSLCKGVCGDKYSSHVYELNRLIRDDTKLSKFVPLSMFVSACLRYISVNRNWIVVSYSDTDMKHTGYIYQATNFIYTGMTPQRTDKYTEGNKHSRHYDKNVDTGLRKVRSAKHRYVYFATFNKKLKREWTKSLKYSIHRYPKTENSNYKLGDFLQPVIIKSNKDINNEKNTETVKNEKPSKEKSIKKQQTKRTGTSGRITVKRKR